MKKLLLFLLLASASFAAVAQVGRTMPNICLLDVHSKSSPIPEIGQKPILIYYVDPDVYEAQAPITDLINSKKYSPKAFKYIAIMNLKDTWVPNWLITRETKKNQKKYPDYLIMLDKDNTFSKALGLGETNNTVQIILVGKDSKIKCVHSVKTKEEGEKIKDKIIEAIEKQM